MKALFDSFQNLNGVTFIAINGYTSKTTGEIANHVINVGLKVENAKKTDLNRLENCTPDDLQMISNASGIALDVCQTALNELLESSRKNLSANIEDRTAQSQGQTDAYISITPAIRFHKESMKVHIFGQAIDKKVLVAGTYKQVKSQPKTIAKNAIKKHLDLRGEKFRDFILERVTSVKMNGETLVIE